MAKLRIIVEVEDIEPALEDPIEIGQELLHHDAPAEVLDAEWIEPFRNGRTPGDAA